MGGFPPVKVVPKSIATMMSGLGVDGMVSGVGSMEYLDARQCRRHPRRKKDLQDYICVGPRANVIRRVTRIRRPWE